MGGAPKLSCECLNGVLGAGDERDGGPRLGEGMGKDSPMPRDAPVISTRFPRMSMC